MPYTPYTPQFLGTKILSDIDLKTLVSYIDWRFFFSAWKLGGRYEGIKEVCDCASCQVGWLQKFSEEERPKAKEAISLYKDAQAMLGDVIESKAISAKAVLGIYPGISKNEGFIFYRDNQQETYIPTLRQQELKNEGGYLSLCDFVSPVRDYIGAFAVTIHGAEELAAEFEKINDSYNAILIKSLTDRLAEATAEWLHEKVRREFWGFASQEHLSMDELLKGRYTSIRPAVGYPSLPDQSIIFQLDELLHMNEIGIFITENGAMLPNASVCGIIISHPKSRYFNLGKIGVDQLEDYAARKKMSVHDIKKWVARNIQ